ncbi:5-(carboxyamino)imidazole ribonucleotide synthase [Halopenitus malekzadehii]|uniref:N5-carboxyaminoimidazole ribonucleotide synthase n=1 Tax=Halopenitus malekzadehii TaxID=1267564 RepID=A0A1H6I265_9EURY|nr:5-(carboxyamino)imidazole ribonucleotide synthase [Halopenitus malekzadehii]
MRSRSKAPRVTVTLPGPTIGIVGGGQLGRMIGEAVARRGIEVVVLDPTPECPAAPVVSEQIVGAFDDEAAIRELADRADVLTYEIELADPDVLETVAAEHDLPVHPDPDTLRTIQDKLVQKSALADAGIPVPPFEAVSSAADLESALDRFGEVMLKARTGGYDGRGNRPVTEVGAIDAALEELGTNAMAEAFVPFERELSVIGVVGADDVRTYPVTETIHREEILRESVTPARTDDGVIDRAETVAHDVLEFLDGRGVYGIELFETPDGEILVNEIAPRPHNSGHWTIEGARTSQFENHARAVLGWPLGPTDLREPTVTANVLGDVDGTGPARLRGVDTVLEAPDVDLHWYGKDDVRPLRKMGHLTVTGVPGSRVDADAISARSERLDRARDLRNAVTFASVDTPDTE